LTAFFFRAENSGRPERFGQKTAGDHRQELRRKPIMRTRITLSCTECKNRNYNTTKEKKNHPERMETKKYCPFCRKHTLHRETK